MLAALKHASLFRHALPKKYKQCAILYKEILPMKKLAQNLDEL
jgi:hypothetical protein